MNKSIILPLFLLLTVISIGVCHAQRDTTIKAGIKVIAKVDKENITIRWGANTAASWQLANQYGYMVERYTIVKRGKTLTTPIQRKITQEPIKPAPLLEWETIAKKDKFGAIAAQALYGKTFDVNTKNSPVFNMVNKSKEQETRFSFAMFCADQSLEVAIMMGLKLTDKFKFSGERYLYKVYAAVPSNILPIDTGYVFEDADQIQILPKPQHLTAEFSDRTAMLSWDNIYSDIYSSYFIERSDDGTTYKTLNKDPYLNTSPEIDNFDKRLYFIDSLPENNKIYYYRIRGKSYFADYGPYTDLVKGKGVFKPKTVPVITGAKIIDNKEAVLTWEFPSEMNGMIKAFRLAYAPSLNSSLKNTNIKIESHKREFLIKDLKSSGYYGIKAIDEQGNEYPSAPYLIQLKDNTPPGPPSGLRGIIDTTGLVTLSWAANRDLDIEGYRVYMSNSLNDEFSQVTNSHVPDTLYRDTTIINTLSKKIYYKLVAVDHHFNVSKFSEVLSLRRPDKVAPAPPVISDCIANDSSIIINYLPSVSEDVVRHIIYRRPSGIEKWVEISRVDSSLKSNSYVDRKIDHKTVYEYYVAAQDDSKNISSAVQIGRAKRIDDYKRPEIEKIKIEADRINRAIVLQWDYKYNELSKFMIYRAEEEMPLKLYKTVLPNALKFEDKGIKIATKYRYVIKAQFKDGGTSPMSKVMAVDF